MKDNPPPHAGGRGGCQACPPLRKMLFLLFFHRIRTPRRIITGTTSPLTRLGPRVSILDLSCAPRELPAIRLSARAQKISAKSKIKPHFFQLGRFPPRYCRGHPRYSRSPAVLSNLGSFCIRSLPRHNQDGALVCWNAGRRCIGGGRPSQQITVFFVHSIYMDPNSVPSTPVVCCDNQCVWPCNFGAWSLRRYIKQISVAECIHTTEK